MSCFSHSPLCLDLNLDFLSRHPRLSSRSVLAKGASSPRGSMSPAPAAGAAKPRVLRFTFGMQSTSAKPCDDMLLEVKRVLAQNAVSYKLTEPFVLVCNHGSVQFEMEICPFESPLSRVIKFRFVDLSLLLATLCIEPILLAFCRSVTYHAYP
eukprot:m.562050 g.562050  ORF g.562050 m.562050 type:complete len:153 (-) comp57797_c0_seq1:265-723(-)